MIRTPLRPLARILEARSKGENPDSIERENLRLRHEQMRDKARVRAEGRLLVMGVMFFCGFMMVGTRMALLASTEPEEPQATVRAAQIISQRADIVDRKGRILATNMETNHLYAHPHEMVDPVQAAKELVKIFPDLKEERLLKDFTSKRKFLWIRKQLSPEQVQAVHDIGEPGLNFGPRETRIYPNGHIASHILGGASFGREGVASAEVVGVAGVEKVFDEFLRDPANGSQPLQLSLDLTVQAATEQVLAGGMMLMNAKGAAGVVMDIKTGELISLVSLPDFDPNNRPVPLTKGSASDSPLFNRSVQGLYELGSTFKLFAASQALELGLVTPDTMLDTRGPLHWGRFRIRDFHNYGAQLSVTQTIVKSSNIGTARLAILIGPERQQEYLRSLGLLDVPPVEILESSGAKPLVPKKWSELSSLTISYGHGLSVSPVHLAGAYASVLNGGTRVRPTLLKQSGPQHGERIVSERTSAQVRSMLRKVVTDGTASFGDVPGYQVAGKTGTADKPKPTGGYYKDKVITTFASVFPASDPKYVVIVTLDEPEDRMGPEPRRTAGWTAVPVAAELIGRIAPLLGMRPEVEPAALGEVTLAAH
ncbi:peptidoglycan D,D-transpeptidase FtsI family protein [Donghicola mangrovi]|uniref:Penicillin-binding protein 2 n=1 Tax=Donghicola mangrovi TaxID=2729614 RepID=A0A850QFI5_9RHOB|nr:penicillin-binding protein 2 [Donghicola mangrovi]NVO24869.1 penicillin-binding protein 2 [Donghicola mangrovi]